MTTWGFDRVPPVWVSVDEAGGQEIGRQGFTITSGEVLLRCLTCDATFPQSDDGRSDLRMHEFEEHQRSVHYDWAELDGLAVRLQLVRRREEPGYFSPPDGHVKVEVVAIAEDGTVYTFPFEGYEDRDDFHGDMRLGYFKFKPRAGLNRLLSAGSAVRSAVRPDDQEAG